MRIYNTQSLSPVYKVMGVKAVCSNNKKDGKNKKNKQGQDRRFSNILSEEVEKTQKVLRR